MQARVVHCKKEKFDVYIGRGSIWGNPFTHKDGTKALYKVGTREEAVESYLGYVLSEPDLLDKIPTLAGKTLGCYCSPKACHGDVLVALASRCIPFGLTDSPFRILFCKQCNLPFWIDCPRLTKTFCSQECIDAYFTK